MAFFAHNLYRTLRTYIERRITINASKMMNIYKYDLFKDHFSVELVYKYTIFRTLSTNEIDFYTWHNDLG